ncbi:hypothetical protein [Bdellovibrio bacteriovorus]|nr:hypothetical protein [Bdellovibrio bacteriovorus]
MGKMIEVEMPKHTLDTPILTMKLLFRTSLRVLFLGIVLLSAMACTPSTTNNYLTANGSDKKLPDDDGYTGSGGTGDGGGGQGILCSDATKNPQYRSKLMVRDIFEASFIQKLKLHPGPAKQGGIQELSDEELQFLHSNLKRYFGHAIGQLEVGSYKFWQKFISNISFIDEEAKLFPSKDANSPIALPNGCKIVQIAFWEDSPGNSQNGTLYVDKKLWTQLDSINRLALLVHEYFFKEARQAGFKNSDFVRAKVGQFFSEFPIKPLFKEWRPAKIMGVAPEALHSYTPSYKFCKGSVKDDPSAELHLYFYNNADVTIPLLKSKNLTISSLQGFDFQISPHSEYPWLNHILSAFNIIHLKSYTPYYLVERASTKFRFDLLNHEESSHMLTDELGRHLWNSGYERKDQTVGQWTSVNMEYASALPKIIWSTKGFTTNATLQFDLENPVSRIVSEKKQELPDINSQIFELFAEDVRQFVEDYRFGNQFVPENLGGEKLDFDNFALSEGEFNNGIISMYAALTFDIQNSVQSGRYHDEFPSWNKVSEDFIPKLFRVKLKSQIRDLKRDLESDFPKLIYKNKAGILSSKERQDLESRYHSLQNKKNEDNDEPQFEIKKGNLVVKSNNLQIDFELNCEGAGETFNRSLLNTIKDHPPSTKMSVNFKIDAIHNPIQPGLGKDRIKHYIENITDIALSQKNQFNFLGDRMALKEHLESSRDIVVKSCTSIDPDFKPPEKFVNSESNDMAEQSVDESEYCIVIDFPITRARYLVIASDVDGFSSPHEISFTPFIFIRGMAKSDDP